MSVSKVISRLQEKIPYEFNDLVHGLQHPREVASELNQLYNQWQAGRAYNPKGTDIFAEDWDNLLILDACRYDEFTRRSNLPGTTEHRISRGSTSPEFVRGNFGGKRLHDVVYVTANDWYAKIKDDIDAEVHALDFVDRDLFDGRTSHPETVAAAAREAAEEYPDKRLVVHFMQPHHPFLGPTAERFDHTAKHFIDGRFGDTIRETDVTHADVMQAYRENLDIVLKEVEPLLDDLSGKTVVTADHGELLGDRERPIPVTLYRHPEGVYVDSLVKVPWHIYQNGERRDIVAEQPTEATDDYDIKQIEQNLRNLGYRT